MKRLSKLLSWWPVEKAIQVACVLGLVALAIMVGGVISGTPLWVVASMSIAQGLGVVAGLTFALSVAADAIARSSKTP